MVYSSNRTNMTYVDGAIFLFWLSYWSHIISEFAMFLTLKRF